MDVIEIGRHKVSEDDAPESRSGINGRIVSLISQAQKLARTMGGAFVVISVFSPKQARKALKVNGGTA